jgi:hypothetical protein
MGIGCARLAMAQDGPILMARPGIWKNLATGATGHYNSGDVGEKLAFAIRGSTWATAGNGCRELPSPVSVNGSRQTWADYGVYGRFYGNDMAYCGVCIAKDGSVWCIAVLGGRVKVQQVYASGKLRFPVNSLGDIGAGTLEDRHTAQIFAQGGTVQAVWRAGRDIYRVNVVRALKASSSPKHMDAKVIARGAYPACTVDAQGNIHLVFVAGNELRYMALK